MNQFVQRVANYVANEIIIKGLAHNKTFQRFAVRTDASLRDVQKKGVETLEQTIRSASTEAGGAVGGPPKPPLRGFPGFVSCFFKEIRKDLGLGS